ncbi:MAG: Smr/MutS family protein [Candidatus Cardinium sp.]|uniref:Smr/MutS family protein n=1 Tax=Cardinium endosymbiont of Dermatophagoides farinae TaxID=2597823 RepID=UPI001182C80A|nr:Smr/MutS family protein [Cardinium endosymbiont of Dermatophagoides farinae]TSJ80806.1 hypothetical protein FPG78_01955 [Cardinium endosymbiont of Dermatophagoides farinae]UWW96810.1 MAG: Smr/MutS family protein [Candidatus Cardinium sp.]
MAILVGSYVRIKNQSAIGQVIDIHLHKALIAFGKLHFYLPLEAVEAVAPAPSIGTMPVKTITMRAPSTAADPILDLHGFNKAQALCALEKFLDRSLLLGHNRLKIIHGQGKGILRSAIRSYLKSHPSVKEVTVKSPIHCMNGMTIVEI